MHSTDPIPLRIASLRRLWPFLGRQRHLVLLWLLALACASAATLALPIALKVMLDDGFSTVTTIDRAFMLMLVAILAFAATAAAEYWLISMLGERVVADLRMRLYSHLIGLDIAFHDRNHSNEMVTRLSTDAELLRNLVGFTLPAAISGSITVIGSLAMLVVTSPKLAVWALLALLLSAVPILMNSERLAGISRAAQDRISAANALAAEALSAMDTVRANARENHERSRYASALKLAIAAADRRIKIQSLITFIAIAMVMSVLLLVLWQGVRAVHAQAISPGELGQFMAYAAILATSFGNLAEIWNDVQRASGGMGRIEELLSEAAIITAPENPSPLPRPLRGELRFEHVSFAYAQRLDTLALHDFELRIRPGETVALVGPSGAGKSTVLSLLLRFHDPSQGRITVDDVDLRALDPVAWRDTVALVPQQPTIFAASVGDNLRYARLDADDTELATALRIARADAFVDALPRRLDTVLGERGALLSGGQQQRIAIARAVLKHAPILLLDEATSALDAQNEHEIQQALDALIRGRTTLVIAHRLATVQKADRIIVMDQGKIVAEGTHAALLAEGGLYAELAKLQLLK
jgi:ATP-binding cassette, subfamily B, bacterial